jgi:GNAT superfamily N-acetyltransferase
MTYSAEPAVQLAGQAYSCAVLLSYGGKPLRIVEITEPGLALDAVYFDVLQLSFPPSELVTVDALGRGVASADASVASLVDSAGCPFAAAVAEWSPTSGVLLLTYLAARPEDRGRGLGSALLRHVRREWVLRYDACAMLAEIEHPAAHRGSAMFGDPAARLRFYAERGGRALDLPHFQPALRPGGERVYGLILAVLELAGAAQGARPGRMAAEPLRRFLTEYLDGTDTGAGSDPAVAALWRGLDRPDGVPLLPLEEPSGLWISTASGPVLPKSGVGETYPGRAG